MLLELFLNVIAPRGPDAAACQLFKIAYHEAAEGDDAPASSQPGAYLDQLFRPFKRTGEDHNVGSPVLHMPGHRFESYQ